MLSCRNHNWVSSMSKERGRDKMESFKEILLSLEIKNKIWGDQTLYVGLYQSLKGRV